MTKKHILSTICTVVIVFTAVYYTSEILKNKSSNIMYDTFYENSEQFDVLFFGSSVVHYGIYPMELWDEYGITSYNMGNDAERLSTTYYTILNSLDYANPKMIVVDLMGMGWEKEVTDGVKEHNFIDSLPLSENKIKTIMELFEKEKRIEYIWPAYLYHSRWEEIEQTDFNYSCSTKYGADILTNIYPMEKPDETVYDESTCDWAVQKGEIIDNIINLCEERNIDVVFIYIPGGARGGDQKMREWCVEYFKDKGVDFIDFLNLESINWKEDFNDLGHLNYNGAIKFTTALGKILQEDYNIINHKTDESYSSVWNEAYEKYKIDSGEIVVQQKN